MNDHQKAMTNIDYLIKSKAGKDQLEAKLQRGTCEFIGMQFPKVYFTSDASSLGASWTTIKNIRATKSSHAHLDLHILHPSFQGEYSFLILEFKKESPYLKSGLLSNEKHIQDQFKTMQLLRKAKGKCEWVWSIDQAIKIITEYLGDPVRDTTPLFA